MSSASPPPDPRRLAALFAASDPEAARDLAAAAAQHQAHTRRSHPPAPLRGTEVAAHRALPGALLVGGSEAPEIAAAAAQHQASTRAPRGRRAAPAAEAARSAPPRQYLHRAPTRSPVLNAFLHEIGSLGLVRADVGVTEEHLLAPRLLEQARRLWLQAMLLMGKTEELRQVRRYTAIVENDAAADFLLQRATRAPGKLGAIARDHESLSEEADPLLRHCVRAAFAGCLAALAVERTGVHALEDLKAELGRLTMVAGRGQRRPAVRTDGGGEGERASPATPAAARRR